VRLTILKATLKTKMLLLDLDNVFGIPVREKKLVATLKKTCSSVRNAFREDVSGITESCALVYSFWQIRDSIDPADFVSLERFTYAMASKYKLGGPVADLSDLYTVHAALLVRHIAHRPPHLC